MTKQVYEIDYENTIPSESSKDDNIRKTVKFKKQAPEVYEKQGWLLHKAFLSQHDRLSIKVS